MEGGFLVQAAEGHAFRHGLIREAAYSGILRRSRVRMHGAVLDALERRPGPADPVVDLLANHAVQAEAWPKAIDYARRAALRAYGRYANPEAVHYYGHALQAAAKLEAGPEQDRALLDLSLGVRWPLFRLGQVAALGPHLDEAVRLAAMQDGHEGLAQAHIMRSHVHWLRGDPGAALSDAEAAAGLARAHGDADLAARARFQAGLVALSQGSVEGTLGPMRDVIAHLGPDPAPGRYGLDAHLLVNAHSYSARAHANAGALGAARAHCDAALAMADRLDQRQTRIYAHLADGVVALAEARPEHARESLARADEYCRGADVRLLSPVAAQFLAQALVASGEAEKALPIARQAVDDAERMGFLALHPQRLSILGETLLATGDAVGAQASAYAAQHLAHRTGEAGAEASALCVLGDALRSRGDAGGAARAYAAGLAIARHLGWAPLARTLAGRLEAVSDARVAAGG